MEGKRTVKDVTYQIMIRVEAASTGSVLTSRVIWPINDMFEFNHVWYEICERCTVKTYQYYPSRPFHALQPI